MISNSKTIPNYWEFYENSWNWFHSLYGQWLWTSQAFYGDILGLKESDCWDDIGWAEFEVPPTILAIHAPTMHGGEPKDMPSGAIFLAVEDIYSTIEELGQKGVRIVYGPVETPICYDAAILDPDGNTIGLHQRKDGTFG